MPKVKDFFVFGVLFHLLLSHPTFSVELTPHQVLRGMRSPVFKTALRVLENQDSQSLDDEVVLSYFFLKEFFETNASIDESLDWIVPIIDQYEEVFPSLRETSIESAQLDSIVSQIPSMYQYSSGETILRFRKITVPGDGNCGFHCLGVTRTSALRALKTKMSENPAFSSRVHEAIEVDVRRWLARFYPQDSQGVVSPQSINQYLDDGMPFSSEYLTLVEQFEFRDQEPELFESNEYKKEGTLPCVAEALGLNVRVWIDLGEDRIQPIAVYKNADGEKYYDLLFDGRIHFDLLSQEPSRFEDYRNELSAQLLSRLGQLREDSRWEGEVRPSALISDRSQNLIPVSKQKRKKSRGGYIFDIFSKLWK